MKITKHCHEECSGNLEVAQGALLGLIVGKTLEITNCFAFPKNYDDSIDEGNLVFLCMKVGLRLSFSIGAMSYILFQRIINWIWWGDYVWSMLIITTSDGIKVLMSVISSVFHCWSLSIIIKLPSKNPSFLFMVIFIFTMRNSVTSYFSYSLLLFQIRIKRLVDF